MTYQTLVMTLLPIIAMINLIMLKKHFLHILLCLEVLTLSMLLYLSFFMTTYNMLMPLLSVVMLTLGACEASLGLTLLVIMVRLYGNDMIKNISLSKC
uniref:NADH dehydrogenase subunit 4L n=1 Tax=Helobdella europaea TaxID=270691 RepID=UPI0023EFA381|nr:NADH dehydrogenase subunit 4L [Helobdella europaea]WDY83667.1 NADH dehydrogenase subunit 4L [Helobdella europaea]